jgi:hypothetical protein
MNTGNKVNGINQWYVNALRDENNITNTASFVDSWVNWRDKLAYQTNTTINVNDVILDNPYFDISSSDYTVTLKKSPGAEDKWVHAVVVSLNSRPSTSYVKNNSSLDIPKTDGADWVFRLDTIIPTTDTFDYYDVRQYRVLRVNVDSNTLQFNGPTPWVTGDTVVCTYESPRFIPNTPYQIIKNNDSYGLVTYDKVLKSYQDVKLYDSIKCYTPNDLALGPMVRDYDLKFELGNIMQYRKSTKSWVRYSTTLNTFLVPIINRGITIYNNGDILPSNMYRISGNKITLLSAVIINNLEVRIPIPTGALFNERADSFTALDGKICSRNWYHTAIDYNKVNSVQFPLYITGVQGVIDFIDGYAAKLKDIGFVFNDYERPRMEADGYIAGWQTEIERFIVKTWSGFNKRFDVNSLHGTNQIYDYYEVNPFKYELWISTPYGILADTLRGPYRDIALTPVVYDQRGTPIATTDNLKIYRTDKETHIAYASTLSGSAATSTHISGMHVYLDNYEHIIAFNDFTTTDNLLHDSFLGLTNEQIDVEFYKHWESSKRPNSGGSVIVNGTLIDNIESRTVNLQDLYSTYADNEQQQYISDARSILGYNNTPYFGNIDSKSKFLFWKGMIHYKGSNKCIDMFMKPGVVEDINLNEVWAYKVSDYGSSSDKLEQDIAVFDTDIVRGTMWLQFTDGVPAPSFTAISKGNLTRWLTLTPDNNGHVSADITNVMRFQINNYPTVTTPHALTTYHTYKRKYITTSIADKVELYVEQNYGVFYTTDYSMHGIEVPQYVVGAGMITCYVGSDLVDIQEITSTLITVPKRTETSQPKVTVIYTRGKLIEDVHYTVINNTLVELVDDPTYDLLDVYTYNDSNNLQVNIIDNVNNVKLHELHLYDPARGIYNPKVVDTVKFINAVDPANYTSEIWNEPEVGVKWLDTTHLGFYRYSDAYVYPNIVDRVALWGSTSVWSHITCYEWIESSVPPEQWSAAVSTSANAVNAHQYTGRPIRTLRKRRVQGTTGYWTNWYDEDTTYQVINLHDYVITDNTFIFKVTLSIDISMDMYRLYVNEIERVDYVGTFNNGYLDTMSISGVTSNDTVRLIRFADKPTISDIGTTMIGSSEYEYVYKYNTINYYDSTGQISANKYYFWVTNQINRSTNGTSTTDVESLFIYNNNPYYFHQNLVDTYDQWIIKNITSIGRNCALQIIKDDTITNGYKGINTHTNYDEWKLISKTSLDKIARALWDKITETMIGETLVGGYAVPSSNIALFDDLNHTTTKYGFKAGQVLGDADVIKGTILALLRNNNFSVVPVDKNTFLSNNNFNTISDIKHTMDYMYNNFGASTVNEIFFTILTTALSYTRELDGVFKTSYITIDCNKVVKHV